MNRQPPNLVRRMATALLLGLLALSGCRDSAPAASDASPQPSAASSQASPQCERETWDVLTIRGARVGYQQTTVTRPSQGDRKLVRTEVLQHLSVPRFGKPSQQDLRLTSVETPDGKLVEFQTELQQGNVPQRTTGRVVGDRLEFETTTKGKKESASIPWEAEYGGPAAVEQTLLSEPLKPSQKRTIHALVPMINQVAVIDLSARDFEPTRLLHGTYSLLRVDTVTRLPDGQTLPIVYWCDRTGDALKTRIAAMDVESFRAGKAEALEKIDPAGFDLGRDLLVKVEQAPKSFEADPHATVQVRYRVSLKDGDPAAVFAAGQSQRVKPLDAHTAEVTVYAIRPGREAGNRDATDDPPSAADKAPNNLIQSDYPKVVALAKEAAGEETDPWKTAVKLELFVHQKIDRRDLSSAFSSAAEVADHPVGDCKAHAVLLAALCRARGIPARVAMGLVYLARERSFAYHLWTEVYVEGRWTPVDATLGRGGIGAAHLKLAHSNLQGPAAYSSFLSVMRVAGRLKIDIEESSSAPSSPRIP